MRITLLGGTGFIGHHVTSWLVEAGQDVSVIHRGQTPARLPGVRSLIADRHDPSLLRHTLSAAAPAVLIDMTAYSGDDMSRLLAALPTSLERLVLISSGDVYWTYATFLGLDSALPPARPLDEDAPLREQRYPYRPRANDPDDLLYQYDKIEVERVARSDAGVPVTILRLPMVYGPGDRQQRVGGYLERFRTGVELLRLNAAEAAWRCTRGYVEDVAWAIQLAALDPRAAGEIFNLGETDALSQAEWVRAIATAADWRGRVIPDPAEPPTLAANWEIPLLANSGRIRRVLGFHERVGRDEGLRRTSALYHPSA
jgi:nucleoside-diphosphate-sugar epimerase